MGIKIVTTFHGWKCYILLSLQCMHELHAKEQSVRSDGACMNYMLKNNVSGLMWFEYNSSYTVKCYFHSGCQVQSLRNNFQQHLVNKGKILIVLIKPFIIQNEFYMQYFMYFTYSFYTQFRRFRRRGWSTWEAAPRWVSQPKDPTLEMQYKNLPCLTGKSFLGLTKRSF